MEKESVVLLETELLQNAADVLRTVAHPMRLQIIHLLKEGEKPVTELAQQLGVQQPYTSQQLNLMKSKGILSSRRNGNQVYYAIANPNVVKVIQCIRGQSSDSDDGNQKCLSKTSDSPDHNEEV
jgi:ArsR family transcriptional regulator